MKIENLLTFSQFSLISSSLWMAFSLTLIFNSPYVNAESSPFNLPAQLDDSNTKVSFKVDSTWHLIEGEVKGITGSAELRDPNDPLSVTAKLSFPLSGFSTNRESRDERLREVMASTEYPQVTFEILEFRPSCGVTLLTNDIECPGTIVGSLKIRAISQKVTLSTLFLKREGYYSVRGTYPISWAEYGVEDPSILVAKLDPTVTVTFSVTLK